MIKRTENFRGGGLSSEVGISNQRWGAEIPRHPRPNLTTDYRYFSTCFYRCYRFFFFLCFLKLWITDYHKRSYALIVSTAWLCTTRCFLVVYNTCITLVLLTTKLTQLISILVTGHSTKFLNVQNRDVNCLAKKIQHFATVRKCQMPLIGSFLQLRTGNECVKFRGKLRSGCSKNGEKL